MSSLKPVTTKPTKDPSIESKIVRSNIDSESKKILLETKKKGDTLNFLKVLLLKHKNLYKLCILCIILIVILYKFF